LAVRVIDRVRLFDQLSTDRFGREMRIHERVDSTNTDATRWAREGAPEGAVVYAEFQRRGRGRHGRTWTAASGQNLTLSVVLRPRLAPEQLGRVTIAAGVAVSNGVQTFVEPRPVAIKWPNDVLVEGRKTCGMLLETSWGGAPAARSRNARVREDGTTAQRTSGTAAPEAVILGIGLNVNQTEFPADLDDRATSLRLATGRALPRETVLARVLQDLEDRYDAALREAQTDSLDAPSAPSTVQSAYEARLDRMGESVTLRFAGTEQTVTGVVRGITPDGALRLQTRDGPTVVHAGEVTSR